MDFVLSIVICDRIYDLYFMIKNKVYNENSKNYPSFTFM